MKKIFLYISLMIAVISCKDSGSDVALPGTDTVQFTKEGVLTITKSDSTTIKLDIEIADNDYETQTGLMYRDHMKKNRGMLFIFDVEEMHSFYMKNTEIPLDIIYIKADKTIATIEKNAKPFDETSLSSRVAVQYVLEVNGGMADSWGLKPGDRVSWTQD